MLRPVHLLSCRTGSVRGYPLLAVVVLAAFAAQTEPLAFSIRGALFGNHDGSRAVTASQWSDGLASTAPERCGVTCGLTNVRRFGKGLVTDSATRGLLADAITRRFKENLWMARHPSQFLMMVREIFSYYQRTPSALIVDQAEMLVAIGDANPNHQAEAMAEWLTVGTVAGAATGLTI